MELSTSVIRRTTEGHARQFFERPELTQAKIVAGQGRAVIAEMDGGMVPVVIVDVNAEDKRKGKRLEWQELKLGLAHQVGNQRLCFGGTFSGDVDQAGQALYQCAVAAGFNAANPVHAVGDGAPWIESQIEDKFGAHGTYLLDFYHACEYLADASSHCSKNSKEWLAEQKALLKDNQYKRVLINLMPHIESNDIVDSAAPVRCAYRYLSNRADQMDYKGAIEKGLPIGSGEIESAHRYVVQKRLKCAGAWWKPENIDAMLAIRLARANQRWDDYWMALLGKKVAA